MNIKTLVPAVMLLIISGCEKEMLLSEFTNYDFYYESELCIEAILNTENPEETVVRIDWTIPVTDTSIFNGRDDDGDWVGYEDLNGNGVWDEDEPLNNDVGEDGMASSESDLFEPDKGEGDGLPTYGEPQVDELDEILPQIHDTTFTVELYNKTTDSKVADFAWTENADSTLDYEDPETGELVFTPYDGYKLTALTEPINYDAEYEFRVYNNDHDIRGSFQPKAPVDYLTDWFTMSQDTLIATENDTLAPIWTSGADPIVFWIAVEKYYSEDSSEVIVDYPSAPYDMENGIYLGADINSLYFPGLYNWTVWVPSYNYGQYIYSSLPITDSSISNWRDENGDVVLGCAGSMAGKSIFVRIDKPIDAYKGN